MTTGFHLYLPYYAQAELAGEDDAQLHVAVPVLHLRPAAPTPAPAPAPAPAADLSGHRLEAPAGDPAVYGSHQERTGPPLPLRGGVGHPPMNPHAMQEGTGEVLLAMAPYHHSTLNVKRAIDAGVCAHRPSNANNSQTDRQTRQTDKTDRKRTIKQTNRQPNRQKQK